MADQWRAVRLALCARETRSWPRHFGAGGSMDLGRVHPCTRFPGTSYGPYNPDVPSGVQLPMQRLKAAETGAQRPR